jgi:hypothetical protein
LIIGPAVALPSCSIAFFSAYALMDSSLIIF